MQYVKQIMPFTNDLNVFLFWFELNSLLRMQYYDLWLNIKFNQMEMFQIKSTEAHKSKQTSNVRY